MNKVIKFLPPLVILAVIALIWRFVPDIGWKYLFFLRLPILVGLFLVLLPTLAKGYLAPMLKNLFVLRNKWQLVAIIVSAIGAGASVSLVSAIILANAPARFSIPPLITIPEIWQYGIAIVLSLNVCISAVNLSKEKLNQPEIKWGTLVGGGLGVGLLLLVSLLRHWLSYNTFLKQLVADILPLFREYDKAGYINPQTGELTTGHLTAIAYFLIGLVVYITVGLIYNPKPEPNRPEAPALLYVLLITAIMVIAYGGVTFYFDYFRIPVLVLFLVFSGLNYWGFNVNHFFQLNKFQASENTKNIDIDAGDFQKFLDKRLQHQQGEKTLVVVCASGGGIQAAGWTVEVLAGLQRLLGKEFTQAIGLISSVSGGSVGAMYYLDHFNQDGCLEDATSTILEGKVRDSFNAATTDSLDAVGWGLAYLDLWRFIGFPFLISSKFDRGAAVETDWQGEMKNPKQLTTLGTWRKQISEGKIPIPVFNATLVENGWRFLITPMTFVKDDEQKGKKYVDFNTLYGAYNYDMSVVTAARLSATFPYVSPISRSNINIPGKNYHVADGGYFDNSGFVTAAEWLDQLLQAKNNSNIKRVLILQINPFPQSPSTENVDGSGGWFMATIGPLLTMFKVRDPVLASRNAQEADLLAKKWQGQVDIRYFPIFFPDDLQHKDLEISEFYCNGKYRPPLSWKLTDKEKKAIKNGWLVIKNESTIQNIKELWQKTWNMPNHKDHSIEKT